MSNVTKTKGIQKRSTKPAINERNLLTVKAMKGVGGSKNTEFNVSLFYRTLKTGVVCHEEGADPEEEARIGCIATGHVGHAAQLEYGGGSTSDDPGTACGRG